MASPTLETYPRAELLVEPEWLAAHLDDPDVRVIDCDPAEAVAARARIPGAVTLPIHPYFRNWETNIGVATAAQTEEVLRGLGVNNDSRVILYDSQGGVLAARVWWVLWHYGHDNAALLNGGWPAWQAAGLPESREPANVAPGNVTAAEHPERIESCDTMLPRLAGGDLLPWDTRTDEEWSGAKPAPNANNQQEGRIPGAVHLEWRNLMDWDDNTRFKPPAEIERLLEDAGIVRGKRVVPY